MIQLEHITTKVRQNVESTAGYDLSVWKQVGVVNGSGDLSNFGAGAVAAVEDLARVKATLIAQVKLANENLVCGLYSLNYGKQKKYSRKQAEVMDWRGLAPAVTSLSSLLTATLSSVLTTFNGIAPAGQRKKFRFAMAQAARRSAVTGLAVGVDAIMGEYEGAIDTIEDQVAFWEAIELEAIRAIKAATTVGAARAVVTNLDWTWKAWTS